MPQQQSLPSSSAIGSGDFQGNAGAAGVAAPPLLTAPIELIGDWRESPPQAVMRVAARARDVCLSGVALLSDRQPQALRIESRNDCYPAIWLHDDDPTLAWMIVTIGDCDWCQLAYQFGHELGHVLCNSWDPLAYPKAPSQWLEESLVEAFTIRGLGLLAVSWEGDPPFAGDRTFADVIRRYRGRLIDKYAKQAPGQTCAQWFDAARAVIEPKGGKSSAAGPATLAILAEFENDERCLSDLCALNRWPSRSAAPLEDYLRLWQASCAQIGAPGKLPITVRRLLGLD